jgi:probable addiction module antidote protein
MIQFNHGFKVLSTPGFDGWLDSLGDLIGAAHIKVRLARVRDGHWGDCVSLGAKIPRGFRMSRLPMKEWDVVAHLRTPGDRVRYLNAAFEEAPDDPAFILRVLGEIARSQGMTDVSRETGLGRESLYKSLSTEGNPSFATVLKVATALGLGFSVKRLNR